MNWGKMVSLTRCFKMMGAYLKLNRAKKHSECAAQLVQCMKSLVEMSCYQDWRIAWPINYLEDPLEVRRHAAREEELEAGMTKLEEEADVDHTIGFD